MKILLLNGANLNMLGKRKPDMYGTQTLAQLQKQVRAYAKQLGANVICKHANGEGELIDILQRTNANAVVLNAGAYSHYGYALRDCIEGLAVPVAEVHMTDIYSREEFRHTDVLKDVCAATFLGRGLQSYLDAVKYLVTL
ncbi:MAG: 3-dehydroquinate dehydratase [Corallococcus sp.]|nr:3-dehydroquinate dehydratase [Corallococcus sp.]MCM1360046.1 3-dehydroquinate dehydratase [Corallococcus sp.]MCM1395603.1 3-dehydroquinate dehydratase [Corallococcus sp.]